MSEDVRPDSVVSDVVVPVVGVSGEELVVVELGLVVVELGLVVVELGLVVVELGLVDVELALVDVELALVVEPEDDGGEGGLGGAVELVASGVVKAGVAPVAEVEALPLSCGELDDALGDDVGVEVAAATWSEVCGCPVEDGFSLRGRRV